MGIKIGVGIDHGLGVETKLSLGWVVGVELDGCWDIFEGKPDVILS